MPSTQLKNYDESKIASRWTQDENRIKSLQINLRELLMHLVPQSSWNVQFNAVCKDLCNLKSKASLL